MVSFRVYILRMASSLQASEPKLCTHFSSLHACCMPRQCHVWFDHSVNPRKRIRVEALLIVWRRIKVTSWNALQPLFILHLRLRLCRHRNVFHALAVEALMFVWAETENIWRNPSVSVLFRLIGTLTSELSKQELMNDGNTVYTCNTVTERRALSILWIRALE